ncbi:pyruvate carboxylase [Streptomyces sp. NBRC 110611]|nr:pyruvate carboxylase [Streptomyces sp. NBRC 110611]
MEQVVTAGLDSSAESLTAARRPLPGNPWGALPLMGRHVCSGPPDGSTCRQYERAGLSRCDGDGPVGKYHADR